MKTMKFFATMFCAVMLFVMTGCTKFEEDDLIGTWNATRMSYTQTVSGLTGSFAQYNGTDTYNQDADANNGATITFNSDHTFTSVVFDEEEGSENMSGTWSLKDDKLTLTYEDDSAVSTIEELDGKKLVLVTTGTETEEIAPGQVAKISYKNTTVFEKM